MIPINFSEPGTDLPPHGKIDVETKGQKIYRYGKQAVKFSFRKDVIVYTYAIKALIIFGPLLYQKYLAGKPPTQ